MPRASQREFMRAMAIAFVSAIALAGCGDTGDDGPPLEDPPVREQGERSEGETQELAAKLILVPTTIQPGAAVTARVENTGDVEIRYGLGLAAERRTSGVWRPATRQIFGTSDPSFRGPLVRLLPGATGQGGGIRLPASLRPGSYRISKGVTAATDEGRRLQLTAILDVAPQASAAH